MKGRQIDPTTKIDLVVDAARRLFVRKGYHNVSIPEIVRESGVSTGAIYHHFGAKESLARHLHDETLEEFAGLLAARVEGREGARARLRAYTELVFEITDDDPTLMEYMLLVRHGEFLEEVPPVCEARPFQWVQEVLVQGMAAGEVAPGDPLLVAAAFTGVVLRVVQLRLQGMIPGPLVPLTDPVFENAWAAVRRRG